MTAPVEAESLPDYRQVGVTAPTSKREALRWLRDELGVTGAQAHALFVAYQCDLERPTVTASTSYSRSFLEFLMAEQPHGIRKLRKTPKREWRCNS